MWLHLEPEETGRVGLGPGGARPAPTEGGPCPLDSTTFWMAKGQGMTGNPTHATAITVQLTLEEIVRVDQVRGDGVTHSAFERELVAGRS